MSPRHIYTELTPRQLDGHRRSIELLNEQIGKFPSAAKLNGLKSAVEAHEKALREGARLVENNNVR